MTLKTRLAVAFVAACLFTIGVLMVLSQDAGARSPVPADQFKAVRAYWQQRADRVKAFDILWCESRYSTRAQNGQFLGAWQMGLMGAGTVWPRFDGSRPGPCRLYVLARQRLVGLGVRMSPAVFIAACVFAAWFVLFVAVCAVYSVALLVLS